MFQLLFFYPPVDIKIFDEYLKDEVTGRKICKKDACKSKQNGKIVNQEELEESGFFFNKSFYLSLNRYEKISNILI